MAIVQMSDALANVAGIRVSIVSNQRGAGEEFEPREPSVRIVRVVPRSRFDHLGGVSMRKALESQLCPGNPIVIQSHGLWSPTNHWACQLAHSRGVVLLVQTHGMLGAVPLSKKGLKKRIALRMYQRRDIERAKVIVATSEGEYEQIRRADFRQPVAILPIGVWPTASNSLLGSEKPGEDSIRTLLYLSRVTTQKGLPELIEAWADLSPRSWRLRIAGPDENGYLREVKALVSRLDVGASVEYSGEVHGDRKDEVYRSADLFVLPSEHENFGVVVLEALQYGLPVITTRATPWHDLETSGCGWCVDVGMEPLRGALQAAMALSDAERNAMGARARRFAARFDWVSIAAQTAEVYHWALGQAPRPECVRLE